MLYGEVKMSDLEEEELEGEMLISGKPQHQEASHIGYGKTETSVCPNSALIPLPLPAVLLLAMIRQSELRCELQNLFDELR